MQSAKKLFMRRTRGYTRRNQMQNEVIHEELQVKVIENNKKGMLP